MDAPVSGRRPSGEAHLVSLDAPLPATPRFHVRGPNDRIKNLPYSAGARFRHSSGIGRPQLVHPRRPSSRSRYAIITPVPAGRNGTVQGPKLPTGRGTLLQGLDARGQDVRPQLGRAEGGPRRAALALPQPCAVLPQAAELGPGAVGWPPQRGSQLKMRDESF